MLEGAFTFKPLHQAPTDAKYAPRDPDGGLSLEIRESQKYRSSEVVRMGCSTRLGPQRDLPKHVKYAYNSTVAVTRHASAASVRFSRGLAGGV